MTKEIWVRLVGDAYGSPTYTKTLKEFMEQRHLKRVDIAEWWIETNHNSDWATSKDQMELFRHS